MSRFATSGKFPIGAKVTPNELFRAQFPQTKVTSGVVIGHPEFGRIVKIKWLERKTPHSLHIDYLTISSESP